MRSGRVKDSNNTIGVQSYGERFPSRLILLYIESALADTRASILCRTVTLMEKAESSGGHSPMPDDDFNGELLVIRSILDRGFNGAPYVTRRRAAATFRSAAVEVS